MITLSVCVAGDSAEGKSRALAVIKTTLENEFFKVEITKEQHEEYLSVLTLVINKCQQNPQS